MAGKSQLERPEKTLEEVTQELNEQPTQSPPAALTDAQIANADLALEDATKLLNSLFPVATAAMERILRNPEKYPSQAVAAAKLVYERKLGAVPDTVIQNNMQFIVKWED